MQTLRHADYSDLCLAQVSFSNIVEERLHLMGTVEGQGRQAADTDPDPRRWAALAVMLLAAAMDLIDVTIVNVAVPAIQADLGGSPAQVEWVIAAYALAFGVLLITGGRLGDAFGRRRVFLLGVAGFTAASALCGLAPSPELLIAARAVQGGCAALMVPQILTIIQISFTTAERPKAYALYGATIAIATVSGPLLGGVLVQADLFDLSWRPIFLINMPIGVLALAATTVLLRESRAAASARLDLGGVALLSAALLLVLYPLIQGPQQDWPGWAFGLMGASLPVLAMFVVQQRAQDRRGYTPLVPMRLFSHRGFTGGLVTQLTLFAAVVGFFLVLAIFLQAGLGFSALHAGLTFLPFSLGIALASGAAGPLAPRLGRRLTTIGSLIMATGMAGLLLAVTLAGAQTNTWSLLPGLVIAGVGMGLVAPTLIDVALTQVDRDDAGAASGVVTAAGQLGGAIGVALIGVVFFGTLPDTASSDPAPGYLAAFRAALWYEIGALLLTAALMVLLPPPVQRAATEGQPRTSVP